MNEHNKASEAQQMVTEPGSQVKNRIILRKYSEIQGKMEKWFITLTDFGREK